MPTALVAMLVWAASTGQPELPPLHRAAAGAGAAGLRSLLDAGAEVNALGPREWTALHHACIAGEADAVRALLERGADPNARGQYDFTPLHWAALQGRATLVPLLTARGARVNARTLHGMTALMMAADEAVVSALLAAGADLSAADDEGMTALHLARSKEVGKALLDRGADLSARTRDGRSLLDMVVVNSLLPEGLLFYGRRASGRLRGERASLDLTVFNVSAREIEALGFSAHSRACLAKVSPASLAALAPGQRARFAMTLERSADVAEGEYPLLVTASAGGRRLGQFDFLTVDTSRAATPEDRGMVRLGKVALEPQRSRAYYLLFAAVPLLAVLGWLWRKRR